MEKIKIIRLPKNWESDVALRILAVIIAVIIWVILSITQYPTTTIQIANVPVVFSLDGTNANSKGLSPVNLPNNLTVNVEIKGMKYEIGGYTEKDLNASVNLNPVNNEGTYSLDINVESNHSSDQFTIVSVSPSTVDISFEKKVTKSFKLDIEAPNVNADNELVLKSSEVSPSEIEVEATENELDKIDKICARVNDNLTLTESTTISTSELVFYDKKGNILQSDKYNVVNNKNFDVKFTVNTEKEMILKVDFSDCPDNFDTKAIPSVLSQDSIKITSPVLDSNSSIEKSVGTIKLSDIDLNKTFDFDIKLNDGEEIIDGDEKVNVTFDKTGMATKSIILSSDNVEIKNSPSDLTAEADIDSLSAVTIIGPSNVINNLSAKDLIIQLDLSSVKKSGTVEVTPLIYSPNHNNVWCCGDYTVKLTLS